MSKLRSKQKGCEHSSLDCLMEALAFDQFSEKPPPMPFSFSFLTQACSSTKNNQAYQVFLQQDESMIQAMVLTETWTFLFLSGSCLGSALWRPSHLSLPPGAGQALTAGLDVTPETLLVSPQEKKRE